MSRSCGAARHEPRGVREDVVVHVRVGTSKKSLQIPTPQARTFAARTIKARASMAHALRPRACRGAAEPSLPLCGRALEAKRILWYLHLRHST